MSRIPPDPFGSLRPQTSHSGSSSREEDWGARTEPVRRVLNEEGCRTGGRVQRELDTPWISLPPTGTACGTSLGLLSPLVQIPLRPRESNFYPLLRLRDNVCPGVLPISSSTSALILTFHSYVGSQYLQGLAHYQRLFEVREVLKKLSATATEVMIVTHPV